MTQRTFLCISLFLIAMNAPAQISGPENLRQFDLQAPQLQSTRTIRVYLPVAYETSNKTYPVLYMHDAQNLFDTATAFSEEWRVDEFLNSGTRPEVIIVGIDHGGAQRINELTPYDNPKYGGGAADQYIDFIRETLKPHIDATFRTKQGSEHTGIMGSSLGGLVSFYAALKYPEIFSISGVFSPSFWYSEKIYDYAETAEIPKNTRFYFLGGTAEDSTLVTNLEKMEELLLQRGLPPENIHLKITAGGKHNEAFWSKEFPEAFFWLFKQD